jgi:putative nucleotidyltransferase with HDIG domain
LRRDIPTLRECNALLATYQSEDRIIRHSRAVAGLAYCIALALAARNVSIDPCLVRAAALLHDLAKGVEAHAEAGAELLRHFEFESVARVVADHTDCPFESRNLNESAIVYLADKLVSGDRVLGLAQRFGKSIERFGDNPVALAAVLRRRATAEAIAEEVEHCLGVQLCSVIGRTELDNPQACQV